MFEIRLAEAFDFTAEDLSANQNGRLSERQKELIDERLKTLRGNFVRSSLSTMAIPGGLGGGITVIAAITTPENTALWSGALVITLLGLLLLWLFVYRPIINRLKHRGYEIESLSGVAKLEQSAGKETSHFILKIRDQQFEIPPDAYKVMKDNGLYVIYYVPRLNWVMAAEESH